MKTLHSSLKRSLLSPGTASYLGADVRRRLLLPYNAVQARKKKRPRLLSGEPLKRLRDEATAFFWLTLWCGVVSLKLQGCYSLDSARTTEKVFLKLINSTLHKLSTFAD